MTWTMMLGKGQKHNYIEEINRQFSRIKAADNMPAKFKKVRFTGLDFQRHVLQIRSLCGRVVEQVGRKHCSDGRATDLKEQIVRYAKENGGLLRNQVNWSAHTEEDWPQRHTDVTKAWMDDTLETLEKFVDMVCEFYDLEDHSD